MNIVTKWLLPIPFEGISMVLAATVYLCLTKRYKKIMILQIIVIIFISSTISLLIKQGYSKKNHDTSLTCAIIQGGYSAKDYNLIEQYPALRNEIAHRYLKHIEECPKSRFIIVPESAFPIYQSQDSQIIQRIKDIAYVRNEYIMTSLLLEEETAIFNAVAFITPEGKVQDIYRKRNVMLFVESNDFKNGTAKTTFMIDGYTIAPLICFDAVFLGNYIRDIHPDLYTVTSNDVFAEGTILSKLHQAYSVINARTMGIALLHITQNGPSCYVDSEGKLVNLTHPYETAIGLQVSIW
jgi:apolipoprotein N-acyltransferase